MNCRGHAREPALCQVEVETAPGIVRCVKLAVVASLVLLLPAAAQAEAVPGSGPPTEAALVAADGSFAAIDPAPGSDLVLYRAVYRDTLSGLPYASLLRTPVRSS
jgi:hypothetical protein